MRAAEEAFDKLVEADDKVAEMEEMMHEQEEAGKENFVESEASPGLRRSKGRVST